MAENTMATVLFISVFVFLFFKFCLGTEDFLSANLPGEEISEEQEPLVLSPRKCPVGSVFSVATGDCKDLVRSSTKTLSQRMQLLMPYLIAPIPGFASGPAEHDIISPR